MPRRRKPPLDQNLRPKPYMKAGHFSAKIPGQLSAEINIPALLADGDRGRGAQAAAPVGDGCVRPPDQSGNQPRIGGKVLVGPNINQSRTAGCSAGGRACRRIWCGRWHGASSVAGLMDAILGPEPRGETAVPMDALSPHRHRSVKRVSCRSHLPRRSPEPARRAPGSNA